MEHLASEKLLLIVLDGFGIGPLNEHNAIFRADTPFYDNLVSAYPHTALLASGTSVGAVEGQIGTSEVGHMNIGAGRVVLQDIARIQHEITNGAFFTNTAFFDAIGHVQKHNSSLHVLGLVSDGGVHSHIKHLYALLELARRQKIFKAYIHAFLDGRDVPPSSAIGFIEDLQKEIANLNCNYNIATLSGRFYAMDRNKNWDRTSRAFDAITKGEGNEFDDPIKAIQHCYDKGVTDEFIEPIIILDNQKKHLVHDNDALIFFNFRADRMRQLVELFLNEPKNEEIATARHSIKNLHIMCMTAYVDDPRGIGVAYFDAPVKNHLSEVLSGYSLPQLKIAETEKYAHLTYFFNGGREEQYAKEDRLMIPSPRVENFAETPFMSSEAITDEAIKNIERGVFPFIAINYCNADMIGHTGSLSAAIKGISFMDKCLSMVVKAARSRNYTVLITADHGNAEEMYNKVVGDVHTAHTLNKVPFIVVNGEKGLLLKENCALANIAPTILDLLRLDKPNEMTAQSLLQR